MIVPTFVGRSRRARLFLAISTALCSGLAAPAFAGSARPALDANGVDLIDGSFNLRLPVASIGAGASALSLVIHDRDADNWSNFYIDQSSFGGVMTILVHLGASGYDKFTSTDGFATSKLGTGATLTRHDPEWSTYRTLDGTSIEFRNPAPNDTGGTTQFCDGYTGTQPCYLLADSIDGRSGMTVHYGWTVESNCTDPFEVDGPRNCNEFWRLGSVSNDAGYQIAWTYVNPTGSPVPAWYRRDTAVLSNTNTGGGSTVTFGYPSTNVTTVTTPGGRTWTVTGIPNRVLGVRRPSATADTTTVTYNGLVVTAVTNDGVTTSYSRSVAGSTATTTVTDALSHGTVVVADLTKQRITSTTNALGQTTAFAYDSAGRPTETTFPEGNKLQYGYDARGNVTSTTAVSKPGSGLASRTATATFPATCVDAACNQPTSTTDAAGRATDYGYDPATGLVTSVTLPAPTPGATRPEARYSYTTAGGVALLTGVSTCRSGAAPACLSTDDETVTTINHDANLQPTAVTTAAGDGSLSATVTSYHDAIGNVVGIDGPLAGLADSTSFTFGADREPLEATGPDPDGSGPRAPVAARTSYNADGQPSLVEMGSVIASGFTAAQGVATTYDANARPVRQDVTAGGTTYGVAQWSYDALGRADCTAVRMNPAAYASLPGACTASAAGSAGPDRISRVTAYDAVNRATAVTAAYATADAATESTSLTANGQVASVTDGEGNRTGYSYDGFDRLVRTSYPVATQGAGVSSTTDYEELGYDAAGNVNSRRLRDGHSITLSSDALNRLTRVQTQFVSPDDYDRDFTYDNVGHLLTAAKFLGGVSTFGWDALGRQTSEANGFYSLASAYDVAGRRTRLTWADGFYVTYGYDAAGGMTEVRENGSALLASYGYDDLGRRTSVTRGNGTSTSYAYDPAGRLNALSHDLAGTSADLSLDFTYNSAGQIATRVSSNDAYSWTGYATGSASHTADGLNRYSAAGGVTPTYDGRGNMTGAGGPSYSFTSDNRLDTAGGIGILRADALGRLMDFSGEALLYGHDGRDTVVEQATTTGHPVVRRYVFGPGTDEPLVWYEGAGTTDKRWLHADERGSVVAVSDSTGAALAINRYDEYGVPAAGNLGRFGYTGQQWIAGLGLWDYKARMYAPSLGRFMQTDPIGYGDGLNLYGYVGGDPVNRVDPLGLAKCAEGASGDVTVCGDLLPSPPGGSLSMPLLSYTPPAAGIVPGEVSTALEGSIGSGLTDPPNTVIVNGRVTPKKLLTSFKRKGVAPWDPLGLSGHYNISQQEAAEIVRVQSIMEAQLRSKHGSTNRKIALHTYRNTTLPILPSFPNGQWYSATIAGGDGGRRLLVNSADYRIFFYSPEHYTFFIPWIVDEE